MCTEQSFWGVYSTELWNAISSAFKRTWFWFQGKMVTSWLVSSRSNFNFLVSSEVLPHSLIVLCHFVSSSPQLVFVLFIWQDEAQRLAIYSIGLWQADEDLSTPEVGEIIYWASGWDICSEQLHLRTVSKEVNPARNMKSWFVVSGCLTIVMMASEALAQLCPSGPSDPSHTKLRNLGLWIFDWIICNCFLNL